MLGISRRRNTLARRGAVAAALLAAALGLAVLVDGTGDAAGLAPRAGSSDVGSSPTSSRNTAATNAPPVGVVPNISLGPGGLVALPDAASQWVAAHPNNAWTPSIKSRMAGEPTALWLTGNESFGNLNAAVHLAAARRGTLTLTLWNIPLRYDGLSSLSKITVSQYETWIDTIAARLHATRAIIVLEPDALWFYDRMPDAASKAQRVAVMRYAVDTLRAKAPLTRVYIDAGTSSGSVTPARMAELLRRGGLGHSAGFAVNVSSYSPTAQIQDYARRIRANLMLDGYRDPRFVIDSGRNGAASWNNDWCNPMSQRLGVAPRLVSSTNGLDLDLWIKAPGTSDGDCGAAGYGAGTYGGEFMPRVAYRMING